MEEKLKPLWEMFGRWKSAKNMELRFLGNGWAKAVFPITENVLSPHPMPMVVGKEIESAASKVGVLAAMTLVGEDEYVVYSHDARIDAPALLEPTVPEEESLIITATVLNDRLARRDLISVRVIVESVYNRRKADYVFCYRILPRGKMERKLLELKKLANLAQKTAH